MLTPEFIDKAPNNISRILLELNNDTIIDMARRINEAGQMTATAEYEMLRLTEITEFEIDFRKRLAEATKKTEEEINALFKEAAESSYTYDKKLYDFKGVKFVPFAENEIMQQLTKAAIAQTMERLENFSQTTAVKMLNPFGVATPLSKAFMQHLDYAVFSATTGVQSYDQAIKQAIKKMTDSGIFRVRYEGENKRPTNRRIEPTVRMNVLTGITQLADEISKQNAKKLGTTTWEYSYHMAHRPSHSWGGMRADETGNDYPTPDDLYASNGGGIFGEWNCRHSRFPAFKEIPPVYSKKELEQMEIENNKIIIFNGKEWTTWDGSQRQRSDERNMRASRLEIEAQKAAERDVTALLAGYKKDIADYKTFSKALGLQPQFERVYMDGLGRILK